MCCSAGYTCIECGVPTQILYKEYSPTVLKLEHCKNCKNPVDKYVEYDNAVVVMDTILQKVPAYRHILHNSEFRSFWKLSAICIICGAYIKWSQNMDSTRINREGFYLDMDWKFYYMLIYAFLELGIQMLLVLMCTYVMSKTNLINTKFIITAKVLEGMLLANFGQLFAIPAVIWGQNQSKVYLWLTEVFILLSNIQVHRAIFCTTRLLALLTVLPGFATRLFLSEFVFN